MNPSTAQEPRDSIRKTMLVEAGVEHAFRVFTEQHGAWWPLATHHIAKVPGRNAVIEPRQGGRWYEQGEDGSQCDWGKVLVWDPPHRLVLAWQISADWQFDPALLTEVEIRFIPEGERKTRVELEHRKLEAYGDKADSIRNMIGGPGGWPGILERFANIVKNG